MTDSRQGAHAPRRPKRRVDYPETTDGAVIDRAFVGWEVSCSRCGVFEQKRTADAADRAARAHRAYHEREWGQ